MVWFLANSYFNSYIRIMNVFTLDIPKSLTWTDDELFEFCVANKSLRIERDKQGHITIMSPSGGLSSYYISIINTDLSIWNRKNKLGIIFESSGGFLLSDGSMRAPDVAFLSKTKWQNLTKKEKTQFPPICPEFVVEVRSNTDRLTVLKDKMENWLHNGCRLAWLIDPQNEHTHIYRSGKKPEVISGFQHKLSGEDVLPGFIFDLADLVDE